MANVPNLNPMVGYTMGCFAHHLSDEIVSQDWCKKAAKASPDFCFPWRLEEMDILKEVLKNNPKDARAHYYLGNLLYDKKQYKEAVEHWQISSQLEPGFSIPWRNLGLASYNLDHDLDKALEYLSKACAVNPQDPRLLLEYDQLCYRKAYSPADRLVNFEKSPLVVAKRDDLVSQQIMLYNCTGQPEKALELASKRSFHPWEGGEGSVSEHYANAHWLLGRRALDQGDAQTALKHFQAGLEFPDNLGEIPREAGVIHLIYESGLANEALGKSAEAVATFEKVAAFKGDLSLVSYYQALALIHLGKELEGINKLEQLLKKATELAANPPGSNFFFYGNPSPVFEDDPQKLQHIYFLFLAGMARAGLGDRIGARSALAQVLAVDQTRLIAHEEFIRL
jgi:tetratricopeptide (TPR) repeat protein